MPTASLEMFCTCITAKRLLVRHAVALACRGVQGHLILGVNNTILQEPGLGCDTCAVDRVSRVVAAKVTNL